MFIVDNNIIKNDILGYLSAQLRSGQPAVIFLYELPPYLSSKIAFDKFLRAISKYPRPITWQTHDKKIAEIITQTHKVKSIDTENLNPQVKKAVSILKEKTASQITVTQKNMLFVLPPSGLPDLFYQDEEIKRWEDSINRAKKVFTKEWFRDQLNISIEKEKIDGQINLKFLVIIAILLIGFLLIWVMFLKNKKLAVIVPKSELKTVIVEQDFTNEVLASGANMERAKFPQGKILLNKNIEKNGENSLKNIDGKQYNILSFQQPNIVNIIAQKPDQTYDLKINEKIFDGKSGQEIGEVVEEVKQKENLKKVTERDLENLKNKNESLNAIFAKEQEEYLKKLYLIKPFSTEIISTNTSHILGDFTEKIQQQTSYKNTFLGVESEKVEKLGTDFKIKEDGEKYIFYK